MDYGIYAVGILVVLVSAGVGAWYLRGAQRGDGAGFFSPRYRRLMVTERLSLEGGRRLVIVRRDDVEHLLLVGGPIDLVVETNITPARDDRDGRADILDLSREAMAGEPSFSVPREPTLTVVPPKPVAQ